MLPALGFTARPLRAHSDQPSSAGLIPGMFGKTYGAGRGVGQGRRHFLGPRATEEAAARPGWAERAGRERPRAACAPSRRPPPAC